MGMTCHQAIVVAGHAGAADIGTDFVDAASCHLANLARQCRTAHAFTAHPGFVGRHIFCGDQIKLRVILGGEARPFR